VGWLVVVLCRWCCLLLPTAAYCLLLCELCCAVLRCRGPLADASGRPLLAQRQGKPATIDRSTWRRIPWRCSVRNTALAETFKTVIEPGVREKKKTGKNSCNNSAYITCAALLLLLLLRGKKTPVTLG
jgi:hypothetical protein